MPITAEFQEREYESFFIQELTKLGSATWSPGQTDECFLGFDGANWVNPLQLMKFGFPVPDFNRHRLLRLWDILQRSLWHGQVIDRHFLDEWLHFANHAFPPKSLNFFVQHKRPCQLTKRGKHGVHWGQGYFEFKIDKQQQKRLQQLENKLGASGVVTYACAAFLRKEELWNHQRKNTILSNSNFVSSKKLAGHDRYTFVKSGHSGYANPDPEVIEDEPLLTRIASAYAKSEGKFSRQVKSAGAAVHEIMNEEDPNKTSLYHQILRRIARNSEVEGYEGARTDGDFLSSLLQVLAFNTVNSTSWAIITAPTR